MGGFRKHSRWHLVGVVSILGLLLSACLGQDFLNAPLELDRFDHGWRVNVEPDEEFSVDLVANPLYPDTPWQLAVADDAVVQHAVTRHLTAGCTPTVESPCPPESELEPFLPSTRFEFVAGAMGESALNFELEVDGRVVDVCEYTIAVVEDSCEGDAGIAANRCGLGDRDPNLDIAIYDHGASLLFAPEATFTVTLAANAMRPEAAWQVVEVDGSVLGLQATEQDSARDPGDWDTADRDKPWHFLPVWRLTFEALGLGDSPLVLEAIADGETIEVFEIAVSVVEDAPDHR